MEFNEVLKTDNIECIGNGMFRGMCDRCQSDVILGQQSNGSSICDTCGEEYTVRWN